jgi:hypothetical protein
MTETMNRIRLLSRNIGLRLRAAFSSFARFFNASTDGQTWHDVSSLPRIFSRVAVLVIRTGDGDVLRTMLVAPDLVLGVSCAGGGASVALAPARNGVLVMALSAGVWCDSMGCGLGVLDPFNALGMPRFNDSVAEYGEGSGGSTAVVSLNPESDDAESTLCSGGGRLGYGDSVALNLAEFLSAAVTASGDPASAVAGSDMPADSGFGVDGALPLGKVVGVTGDLRSIIAPNVVGGFDAEMPACFSISTSIVVEDVMLAGFVGFYCWWLESGDSTVPVPAAAGAARCSNLAGRRNTCRANVE